MINLVVIYVAMVEYWGTKCCFRTHMFSLNLMSFIPYPQRTQQFVKMSRSRAPGGGNHSSVSSEGFCDGDIAPRPEQEETDSQGGGR